MTDEQNDDLPARLVSPGPGGEGRTRWEVTAKGLAIIEELAGRGCHLTTIAQVLGMHVATLREVRKRDPEVDEAYQRGLAREHDQLVGNLRTLADEGNVVANIFLLKAKHGFKEGEAQANLSLSVNTGGVLVVPQKQSVEDFLRDAEMRDVTPRIARDE
ncbi:hypothetical protein [Primorskyibacter sp. 2E233]|uniref:hypothetical protein n=1 Tax=Primorskyibacter sp. 2E233 TaxID=3413431 RepID=UPI003BF22A09